MVTELFWGAAQGTLIPDAGSRPLWQGKDESSRLAAKRNKAMVQIEALCLFILGIDDERVNGNFGPARTLYCIPQQGASEFAAMIGARDGKAPQGCDGHRRIAWQTFGESDWNLREEDPGRG